MDFFSRFFEVFWHAAKDTLPLLPWIFILYVLIELLENKADFSRVSKLSGRLGPLVGSAVGILPQCGFSVMAAKFFERKYITVGTLLAIFMATSDEALILMLGSGEGAVWILPTVAIKVVVGISVGYATDFFVNTFWHRQVCVEMPSSAEKAPKSAHEYFINAYVEEKETDVTCSCGRKHDGESDVKNYFLLPLLHTLKVALFIFLVNFLLTAIIHGVGEEAFASFMRGNRFLQPFVGCAVGLIPNCASSVVLTETFLSGAITFGTCVAGLCVNAGMGFVVLLRNVREWKRNLALVAVCYVLSVGIGLLLNLFPIVA